MLNWAEYEEEDPKPRKTVFPMTAWIVAIALVLGGVFYASKLYADESYIVTSGLAYHFEKGHDYNWLTAGAGFEKQVKEDWRLAGGFYLNSNRAWSTYLAGVWLPLSKYVLEGVARAGIIAGGVTGYQHRVTPVAGLATAYEMRGYGINVIVIPPASSEGGVLWIQLKTKW